MSKVIRSLAFLAVSAAVLPGCALNILDRWDGDVVRSQTVPAEPDAVWRDLTAELPSAGLLVAGVSDRERTIEFSWVTAPGDGRQYLDCDSESVGSASIRPRVALVESGRGTRIEVSSITRATAASGCTSTGNFEAWLLTRIGVPASALAAATPRLGRK